MSRWAFPIGAILNAGGVFLYALLGRQSFENTQVWALSAISMLLVGMALVIVGSFFDRRRLPIAQARVRGVLCWITSGILFSLLVFIGNVHSWTFACIFPAFASLITGAVLLLKGTDAEPAQ